jgi:hypothetical protein
MTNVLKDKDNQMVERTLPQTMRMSHKNRALAVGAERPHSRHVVKIAEPDQVRAVLKLMAEGMAYKAACARMKVDSAAVGRRVRHDPVLRQEQGWEMIMDAYSRAQAASANGNAAALGVLAKLARDGAAALDPGMWGDRVQVESRQLIVHTNLDFTGVVESLDGFVQGLPEPGNVPPPHTETPKKVED